MTTAIIGAGRIGTAVAGHLVAGGEAIVLASRERSDAERLAETLGGNAKAAPVAEAIDAADAVLFAVWFDTIKELVATHARALRGKVVIDPSNPIAIDAKGNVTRTLPDGTSAGSVLAKLVPSDANFVKAFGTLSADSLASAANRSPRRAVLFYATEDAQSAATAARLITKAGFDPVPAGGVEASLRIEVFGDLHDMGGLNGKLLDLEEAKAAVAAGAATARA